MKFMKLGSKPDTFYSTESFRSVSSEVSSDLLIEVKGTRYLLHKFPLLSKSALLQKLYAETIQPDENNPTSPRTTTISLPDFPCELSSFDLCAKFCYGITVTLSAHNILSARLAAEYLQMNEQAEKGNLVHKLEAFFASCILRGWKDTLVALHSTKSFPNAAESLGFTHRCIEALAAKVLARPGKTGHGKGKGGGSSEGGWWGEDLAELGIDLYWRTMIAIKSGGKVPSTLIGESLQIYASRWFPSKKHQHQQQQKNRASETTTDEKAANRRHRLLLESIVSLLPAEKGAVPCGFLMKLIKAGNKLGSSASSKAELARRVGMQLEDASVRDLLIPSSTDTSTYDVDVVMGALEEFKLRGKMSSTSPVRAAGRRERDRDRDREEDIRRRRSRSAESIRGFEESGSRRSSTSYSPHGAKIKVARLVDGYLREIAGDPKLPLGKMIAIAESVPDFARVDHDDLYRAVDTYLKAHPELSKSERKRLCRILDCKRLSMESCLHAAQNELLPLRVVVQVLFFEHARAAKAAGTKLTDLPPNIKALLIKGGGGGSHQLDDLDSLASSTAPALPPPPSRARTSVHPADQDQWSVSSAGLKKKPAAAAKAKAKAGPPVKIPTLKMKLEEDEEGEDANNKKNIRSVPANGAANARPKRMFNRMMSVKCQHE